MTDQILATRDLTVSYKTRFGTRKTVGPFDLFLRQGEFVFLAGPNGSGKSTLLRSIARLQTCEGVIQDGGTTISYLPQRPSELLFPWLTLEQHLDAFCQEPRDIHIKETSRLLTELQWPSEKPLASTTAGSLSIGFRQVFSFCLVLGHPRARLVLLDEPLSSLDRERRAEAIRVLRARSEARSQTYLVASHYGFSIPNSRIVDLS